MIYPRPRIPRTTVAACAVVAVVSAALLVTMTPTATAPGAGAQTVVNPTLPVSGARPGGATTGSTGLVDSKPGGIAVATTRAGTPSSSVPWLVRPSSGPPRPPVFTVPSEADPTGQPTRVVPAPPSGVGSLIWAGKPSAGQSQFALLDCDKPGSLTIENDLQFGPIWVFNKPAGDKRCETHGIALNKSKYKFADNETYYIGWWSKVSSTANNNADFQWKSYGNGMTQDYPFVISAANGHASMFQRQPGSNGQTIWTSPTPLTADTWNHYIIGIHTSDALTGGWIQLWYDGKPQTFINGATEYACRTWDVSNDPKWGEYGAQATAVTNYVYAPKVGTSYTSVAS